MDTLVTVLAVVVAGVLFLAPMVASKFMSNPEYKGLVRK